MKKTTTNDPKTAVDLLNRFYTIARERFAGGTPGRLAIVIMLNDVHDDVCDGKQAHCMRCAEFRGGH